MTDLDIKNLRYDRKEVGKTFSSSKILHKWEFILNNKYHKIEFYDSRLSYKRKIILDSSVLFYKKDDREFFVFKFTLAGHKFEINQVNLDKYDIRIDGIRFQHLMAKERNGELDKEREEQEQQEEIDEYNRRALEYNGSNYYEGMEYKIMEQEREKERQRERQRQRERERERERQREQEEEESDEFFDDNEIRQIKNNIDNTMNKFGGGNNNSYNNNII